MIKHTYPGKFIVIEGLDGSGKSSQVDLLVKFLQERGKEVVLRSEPTRDSEAGIKIRQILKGELVASAMERQILFVEDRREHLEKQIIPALKEGKFVVCSRYAFSTIAYGFSDDLDVDELVKMNAEFLLPDVTLLIDVTPEECIKRIEKRGEVKELFEKLEKLKKVNEVYQKLPEMFSTKDGSASGGENIFIVDGEKNMQEVFEDIKKIISNLL